MTHDSDCLTSKRFPRFLFLCVFASCSSLQSKTAPPDVLTFRTPEEAVSRLKQVTDDTDREGLRALFGQEGFDLVVSGDPEIDKFRLQQFRTKIREGHRVEKTNEATALLRVGSRDWPFPVPLSLGRNGWYFDSDAGREEVMNRVVGRNELRTIEVLRFIPVAQREYAAIQAADSEHPRYALRFISTPGNRDGLYWEARPGEARSPLGPFIASAQSEGYQLKPDQSSQPYYGYRYRLVSRAEGDKHSYYYVAFAYPAVYGKTGVMSFAITPTGEIFEQDLGPEADRVIATLTIDALDSSWKRVE